MPLIKSGSKAAVSANIAAERKAGRPERQAVAIALDVARRAKRASGGRVGRAEGGPTNMGATQGYDPYATLSPDTVLNKDGRPEFTPKYPIPQFWPGESFKDYAFHMPPTTAARNLGSDLIDVNERGIWNANKPAEQIMRHRAEGGPTVEEDSRDYVNNGDRVANEIGRLRRHTQVQALAGREPPVEDIAALEAYKPELLKRQAGLLSQGAPILMGAPAVGAILARPAIASGLAGMYGALSPSALGQGDRIPAEAQDDMARFVKGWQENNPRRSTNRAKSEDEARKAYETSDVGRRMNDPKFTYSAAAKARNEKEFIDNYFKRNPIDTDESVEDYARRGMAAWNERRNLALQDTAAQRADQAYKTSRENRSFSETPFEDTWWGRNVNPTATPAIVGGTTGLTLGLKDAISGHAAANRWENALDSAENATTPVASLGAKARVNAAQAASGKGYGYMLPMALGAFEGASSTMLPIMWNRGLTEVNPERRALESALAELPADHPDRYRYEPRLKDANAPGYAPQINPAKSHALKTETLIDAIPEVFGRAAIGAGAATMGRLPGTIFSPSKNRISDLESRTNQTALTPQQAEAEAVRMFGVNQVDQAYKSAMDQSSIRALKVARDLAQARRSGTNALQRQQNGQMLENEAAALEAGAGTGPKGSPAGVVEAGPAIGRPALQDRLQGLTPPSLPLGIEAGSNSARSTPTLNGLPEGHVFDPRGAGSQVRSPMGHWVAHPEGFEPPKQISAPEPVKQGNAKGTNRLQLSNGKDAVKAREPVPEGKVERDAEFDLRDPGKDRKGQKNGGVSRAMDIARKYADGGVIVGPVMGDTGGRTDALPVSVPSGAFVIPADCVSALGEGNTGAGMMLLQRQWGGRAMASGGSPVPIKISDGEFVVSPDAVAKIGNGDMDAGHRALDAFVRQVRANHVKTLKSLPGPAR